jgi:beta-lactamase regulating signal transducer with metallopeptidase domain
MNTVGIALVWCIVQVTAVGLLAGGMYLMIRRVRPAAAATVVLTTLVMVATLSLASLSPWPRWDSGERKAESRGRYAESGTRIAEGETRMNHDEARTVDRKGPREENGTPLAEIDDIAPTDAPQPLVSLIRQTIAQALSPPAESASWRWPAIVALVLFATAACGLGWLVLGIVAVRRQCRQSQPVSDPEVLELVDVLRAELSCLRTVEVRQADDLVTAAAIGWRRPVVLLPADWQSWTVEQRHAVLAHEIAHARSQDFLALLVAHLGLMLHFYHPLLHWLMNRLRLEQELAADAAAARVSGGQRAYLTAIAELALQSQDRPLSWPARSFLPTQTTFLRRISMLKDSKVCTEPLSRWARWSTITAVLCCGLLAVGVRGPGSQQQVLAADGKVAGEQAVLAAVADAPETAQKVAPQGENILVNPGAENGDDYAEHWVQGAPIDGVKYLWDKENASEGNASLCIKKTVNNYFPIAQWSQAVKRSGNLPALEVSTQVKTKKMYKAVVDVIFLDEMGKPISHKWAAHIGAKNQGDPAADHDWKRYSGTVAIPKGTEKICIALQDYGPGTVWFDDIQARYVQLSPTKRPTVPKP